MTSASILPSLRRCTCAATLTLLAAGSVVYLAGCNIIGPAAYFITGPAKTKKQYTLDPKRPTVVFVDDRGNRVPRRAVRNLIAQTADKALLSEGVVKDLISSDSAALAAGQDRTAKPIPISQIGRDVKADVVIYATVDMFTLSADGQSLSPQAIIRVKVIDAVEDKRLWPPQPQGAVLTVRSNVKTTDMPQSTADRNKLEDELAKLAGDEIAWLFYDHLPPQGLKNPD